MNASFTRLFREHLLNVDGVKRLNPARRAAVVYTTDSPADSVYFLETGFVKLVQKGTDGKEVLLSVIGPGEIFGEQCVLYGGRRSTGAEVLQDGIIHEIPKNVFVDFCTRHADAWRWFAERQLEQTRAAEQKIGMLCLYDVETRILFYLGTLSSVFGVQPVDGQEYSLPLSQSELACLVGATRETTSTTLNALARKGILKLGRRLMTVSSQEKLSEALKERSHAARA